MNHEAYLLNLLKVLLDSFQFLVFFHLLLPYWFISILKGKGGGGGRSICLLTNVYWACEEQVGVKSDTLYWQSVCSPYWYSYVVGKLV